MVSIEPKDRRTCFAPKSCLTMLTELVKLCYQDIYIDVSHTEHSMNLQIKTTYYIRGVNINLLTVTETLPLGHSSSEKCAIFMVPLNCRILNFKS